MHNLVAQLDQMAKDDGDRTAFIDVSGPSPVTTSYAELHDDVCAFAGSLVKRGVGEGSRVVTFVPLSRELYIILLAVFRVGATAVFIDPWGTRSFIDHAARLVDPTMFIGVPKAHALRLFSPALRGADSHIVSTVMGGSFGTAVARAASGGTVSALVDEGRAQPFEDLAPVTPDDTALVTFTSGSTGMPKGADRTHGLLWAQHEELVHHVDQGPRDVHATNLPVFVLHNLAVGTPSVLPPVELAQDPKASGDALIRVVHDSGATLLTLSPEPLRSMVTAGRDNPVTNIRQIYTGGGAVPPSLCSSVTDSFPNARLEVLYGSTEAEPIAHASGTDVVASRRHMLHGGGLFVGRSVDGTDLVLVPPTDAPLDPADDGTVESLAVATGDAGEVVVAGDHVNRSYLDNPQAVRDNKIVDAAGRTWHRTGDVARMNRLGAIWLLGRVGSEITVGTQTIWPYEIEMALQDHPTIARTAIVTLDGATVLAVEPAPSAKPSDAGDHVLAWLSDQAMHGIEVALLDDIPVDPRHATKIDVAALRKVLPAAPRLTDRTKNDSSTGR